jgi:MFS family permease
MQHGEFTRKSVGAAVAAWMGLFVGPNAILSSTQGQFMVPMAQTFGLNRTLISVVLLISPLGVTLCLPAAGRAIDRWGLRRVLIPGLVAFGLLHILLSVVANLWQLLAVMALISVTAAMHSSVGYAKVISQWFDRKRGTVLGLAVALGSGLGSALFPQIMQITISGHGWRMGYAVLGTIVLVLGLPVLLPLLREPKVPGAAGARSDDDAPLPGASRAEALHSRTFWLIFTAILLTMTALLGTVMHAFPMLTERGFSAELATTGISFIFLGSAVGQLTSGFLVDAWHSPRAALPFFLVALVGVLVLHSATSNATMLGGALLLGTALGAENGLAAYLTSRYFGLRAYGSIFSWTFAAAVLGVVVGLIMMGVAHDLTGSYAPMRVIFSVFVGIAVVCIALLGPYVYVSQPAR